MKKYKDFINEAEQEYMITFKVKGKAQKQMTMKKEKAKKEVRKLISHFRGSDSGDIQTTDLFKSVDSGKAKSVKIDDKEIVVQKA